MDMLKKHHEWIPAIFIAIVLGSSLPFKFTDAAVTVHIFNVVGEFLGLDFFKTSGAYIIGTAELITTVLVLIPSRRGLGGLFAVGIMSGAIFFHLATPLGVEVHYMENGVPMVESQLFYMAVVTWVCGAYLALKNKDSLPIIGSKA